MGRRILLMNLVMLAGLVLLARHMTVQWHDYERTHNVQRIVDQTPVREVSATASADRGSLQSVPPITDFLVIGEKSLFNPERRPDVPDAEAQEADQAPPIQRKPNLTSIMTIAGKRQAVLNVFEPGSQSPVRKIVSVDDQVQGWTVGEIGASSVTLNWKTQEMVIDMSDSPAAQPKQIASAMAPVTVIKVGSAFEAVETTTPETQAADESKGVTVGVVGGQGQRPGAQGRGGRAGQGLTGRGTQGGLGMRGGQSGRLGSSGGYGRTGSGMMGGSSTLGLPGSYRSQQPITPQNY